MAVFWGARGGHGWLGDPTSGRERERGLVGNERRGMEGRSIAEAEQTVDREI
jgi:hypothetical protein